MSPVTVEGDDQRAAAVVRSLRDRDLDVGWVRQGSRAETASETVMIVSDDPETVMAGVSSASSSGSRIFAATQSVRCFELLSQVPSARCPVVAGVSWTPGLSAILARKARDELGDLVAVKVTWVASAFSRRSAGGIPAVMEAIGLAGAVFDSGQWRRSKGSGYEEQVYLPEPLGWKKVMPCAGSEPLTLPKTLGVRDQVVVRCGITEPAGYAAVKLARSLAQPERSSLRARVSGALAATGAKASMVSGRGQSWSALRVDATGGPSSDSKTLTYAVMDDLDHLESAIAVASLRALEKVDIPDGFHTLEELVEPDRFLDLLTYEGVRVAELHRG